MRVQLHKTYRTGGRWEERLWNPGFYHVPRDMPAEVARGALAAGCGVEVDPFVLAPEAPARMDDPVCERVKKVWEGTVIVAATGPSLTAEVCGALMNQRVVAVNDAWRLLPWADVLYGGDADWWEVHGGVPGFVGEKWSAHDDEGNPKKAEAALYGLRLVRGRDAPGFSADRDFVHYGGNSGFQGVNLALHKGGNPVVLVGFDMKTKGGKRHFFGDHPAGLGNQSRYEDFVAAYKVAAKELPAGVRIINATPGSALRCFENMRLEDALAC